MSLNTTPVLLDCGHPESVHSPITSGWGTDADGKRYCYDCCTAKDFAYMAEHGRISAYLSEDGKRVTNWPGRTLMHVTRETASSAGGFATHTTISRVWARAVDGAWWYGRGPGRGMYIRMHRSKAKR